MWNNHRENVSTYDVGHMAKRSVSILMPLTSAAAAGAADRGKTMGSTVPSHASADSEGWHRKCHDCLFVCCNAESCPCHPGSFSTQPFSWTAGEVLGERVWPVADGDRQKQTDKHTFSPISRTHQLVNIHFNMFNISHHPGLGLDLILKIIITISLWN